MTCKLSPIISVDSVELDVSPYVKVSVVVKGAFSDFLKDEELSKYIRAVCVLSIYDPDSQEVSNSVEAVLESKAHWKDTEWYKNARGWDAYLRAEKVLPTDSAVFDIDLSDIVRAGEVITQDDKVSWNKTYLSYFTYIQVNTQQMAEDFNIAIADEYKGMAGDYETGVIMIGGVVVDSDERSFNVRDLREVVEEEPVDGGSCSP